MKEAIRCFVACFLPCGALDVIRIVHASGRVEEISGTVNAGEIMRAYPKHVLRKPPSTSSSDGTPMAAAVILPPHAELQKGKIYFLIPAASPPPPPEEKARRGTIGPRRRNKKRDQADDDTPTVAVAVAVAAAAVDKTRMQLLSERYLSEILSEKASTQRDRRRGRVGIWRPHLESISEVSNDPEQFLSSSVRL